jgi:hypothetical protein
MQTRLEYRSANSTPSTTSTSSVDEDDLNRRISPHWHRYQEILQRRGFHLDTYRDVKNFYESYGRTSASQLNQLLGYSRVCREYNESMLCKDAGLVSARNKF